MYLQSRIRVITLVTALALGLAVGVVQASPQKAAPRPQTPASQGITGALWSWISPLLGVQGGSGRGPGFHAIWQQEGCTMDPNGGPCIYGVVSPGTSRPGHPKI